MLHESRTAATIDDLYHVEGKAELIGGRVVQLMATGRKPHRVAFGIALALNEYALATGRGEAYADNMGFAVPELASGRESFSPDAAYYVGPFPSNNMRFIEGPPTFAVEVRGEGDYGPSAESAMAAKRLDYFEAGSLVVWDVDPEAETVAVYRADAPESPTLLARGQEADAEPAVPGWRIAVDRIF